MVGSMPSPTLAWATIGPLQSWNCPGLVAVMVAMLLFGVDPSIRKVSRWQT